MTNAQEVDRQLAQELRVSFGRNDDDEIVYVCLKKGNAEFYMSGLQAQALGDQLKKKFYGE